MSNLKSKIRDDIAGMIPDEVVSDMGKQVLKEEFLTKKQVKKPNAGYYEDKYEEKPSEFQKMVLENAVPLLKEEARKFFESNKELIETQCREILTKGFSDMFMNVMRDMIAKQIADNNYNLVNNLRNQH